MKDNNFLAPVAADPNYVSAQPAATRQQTATAKSEASKKPSLIAESERINRRYSIDDNGGGYLGL